MKTEATESHRLRLLASIPAQKEAPIPPPQTNKPWDGHRIINAEELPPRNMHLNGLKTLKGDMLPPLHLSLDKKILNNKTVNNMKDKILVEIQSDYEIRGQITAFEEVEKWSNRDLSWLFSVHLMTDLEYDSSVGNPRIDILLYDEDGDILARDHVSIQSLCSDGCYIIKLPKDRHAKKMVLRTKK